ncbi:MAG: threonylcarbamoyl-AMP synthase [Clostridia bacterium]|nr:threonylcarbamoyl-AMP synthase [Clostridia bacterium]
MEYIKLSKENQKDIKKVIDTLNKNGVVILPTDTVYGIAADASNEEAVRKIYEVKHRKFTKPCNILVSNIDMIRKVTKNVSPEEEKIMKKYFPGALTMIFDKNDKIPNIVTANLDTIGIRMPNNKFLLELIEKYGKPIVATSLNLAGEESYTNVEKIEKTLKNNVDLIVDGGETKIGIPSTIIKIEDKKIRILREGPITKEELQKEI